MNKKLSTVLIIIVGLSSLSVFADSRALPRVAVQAPLVSGDDVQLEAVANVVQETMAYMLESLNRYDIVYKKDINPEDLATVCNDNNIDTFISGETGSSGNGETLILRLFAYDRSSGRIVEEVEQSTESVFDIFDMVDGMVKDLLEKFSGIHIAYGSLGLSNSGFDAPYAVFIDGRLAVLQNGTVPSILIGDHDILITQNRMFGEYEVMRQHFTISENKRTALSFTLPELTEAELALLEEADAFIEKNRDKKRKEEKIDEQFTAVLAHLDDTTYSPEAARWKEQFEGRKIEWEAYKEARRNRKYQSKNPAIMLPDGQINNPVWFSEYNPAITALLNTGIIYSSINNHSTTESESRTELDNTDNYITTYTIFENNSQLGYLLPVSENFGFSLETSYLMTLNDYGPEDFNLDLDVDNNTDFAVTQINNYPYYFTVASGVSKRFGSFSVGVSGSYLYEPYSGDDEGVIYNDEYLDNESYKDSGTSFVSGESYPYALKLENGYSATLGLAYFSADEKIYWDLSTGYLSLPVYYINTDELTLSQTFHPLYTQSNLGISFFDKKLLLRNKLRADLRILNDLGGIFLRETPYLEITPGRLLTLRGGFQFNMSNGGQENFIYGLGYLASASINLKNLILTSAYYAGTENSDIIQGSNFNFQTVKLAVSYNNFWPRKN